MTLDEAIKHAEEVVEEKENEGKLLCQSEAASIGCLTCANEHRQLAEWLKDYKRLLEQQPTTTTNNNEPITVIYPTIVCDDAISRQAVIDMIEGFIADATSHGISPRLDPYYVMNGIKGLPSVTQKYGKWIKQTLSVKPFGEDTVLCNQCAFMTDKDSMYNYCPNCGAKMVETQESEKVR